MISADSPGGTERERQQIGGDDESCLLGVRHLDDAALRSWMKPLVDGIAR